MTQQERLLDLLRKGPVTPLMGWGETGIYRTADPVEKLRKKGYKIDTRIVEFTTRRRNEWVTMKFAQYTLVSEPRKR